MNENNDKKIALINNNKKKTLQLQIKMFTHLLLLLLVQLVSTNQKFAIEPENQSVLLGTKITLPCRVVDLQGVLQWTKDDFGLGTHRNLSGFERYKMIGTDNDGDYSLEIDAIELDDDAKYQCQVSPGPNGELGIRSRYATVTVLVPPEPPIIKQGTFKLTTEDDELQLECMSNGGKPAAEVSFIYLYIHIINIIIIFYIIIYIFFVVQL